jgi:hypothetical protein
MYHVLLKCVTYDGAIVNRIHFVFNHNKINGLHRDGDFDNVNFLKMRHERGEESGIICNGLLTKFWPYDFQYIRSKPW